MFWSCVYPEADANANLLVNWDMFHRVDLAVSKAVGETPCALELFDVARALAALFGVGDGRVICELQQTRSGQSVFACLIRVAHEGGLL